MYHINMLKNKLIYVEFYLFIVVKNNINNLGGLMDSNYYRITNRNNTSEIDVI